MRMDRPAAKTISEHELPIAANLLSVLMSVYKRSNIMMIYVKMINRMRETINITIRAAMRSIYF